jgi:hypothetical protein
VALVLCALAMIAAALATIASRQIAHAHGPTLILRQSARLAARRAR